MIKIAQDLDRKGHYKEADLLFKIALDFTNVLQHGNKIGEGSYGSYYTNFDDQKIKELKNKVGTVPNNIGIKEFHYFDSDRYDIIKENVCCYLLGPFNC